MTNDTAEASAVIKNDKVKLLFREIIQWNKRPKQKANTYSVIPINYTAISYRVSHHLLSFTNVVINYVLFYKSTK